jgi:hypothetical protein
VKVHESKIHLALFPSNFTTFTTFAKFAKFANFNPALEHPTLIHRHAPHLRSLSERRPYATSPSPCAQGEGSGEGRAGRGGEGRG